MTKKESSLEGWGRHRVIGSEVRPERLERASSIGSIARGLGRSYGDASLPPASSPVALNTTQANRILGFDESSGEIQVEAGLSLDELNRIFIPRGFFTPVTPGTKYVTVGGMVAADIHGKDQHEAGNFGDHLSTLKMATADERIVMCSRDENESLFNGTVGGMGLTGHILEATFKMRRIPTPWIYQYTRRIANIDEFQDALEEEAKRWPYTVGWIDCATQGANMGRGILICGRWAEADEVPSHAPKTLPRPTLPFEFPSFALNKFSIRAFNELYFRKHLKKEQEGLVSPETFFYPLDFLRKWNRMYGRRGFTQYQCVLPREAGRGSAKRLLEELTKRGGASFLAVIKDFGSESFGTLSFPKPGITLALDIPLRSDTQELVDALNRVTMNEGGRIYLAKDSFTRAEDFYAMENERLTTFSEIRDEWDPGRRFKSALSVRLFGDDT